MLQRKDIDAVVIATPDHWHGVQTVHACECGKHVYVEKPACCTIEEGKAMVAAAQKNKIAVQVGSQGRSTPDCHAAVTYLRNGMLGKVSKVTCWHYPSPAGGEQPDSPCPPELDWDLWLGPLRWRPYNTAYYHGAFRWFLESGGGQIRDRGAHVMSCALYLMDSDQKGPVSIEAKGTAPTKGLWDSAVDMEVVYTFKDPDWTLIWAQPGDKPPKGDQGHNDYGAVYHGDKDKLILYGGDGGTWTEKKARDFKVPAGGIEVYKSPGHKEDWFAGIKTGRKTIMNIEAGVATANLTVLGNLSFTLGRKIAVGPGQAGDRRRRAGPPHDEPPAAIPVLPIMSALLTAEREHPTAAKDTKMDEELTVDTLIAKLKDKDDKVRAAAWQGAGKVGAAAMKPLAALAQDGALEVSRSAVRAMWAIVRYAGRPGAEAERKATVDALLELFRDGQQPIQLRRDMVWMLSEIIQDGEIDVDGAAQFLADPDLREDVRAALQRVAGDKRHRGPQGRAGSRPRGLQAGDCRLAAGPRRRRSPACPT